MYRVMVVDDEPIARKHLYNIILKKCPNFEVVIEAENGRDGLDKLKQSADDLPDLVITDARMPVMNGIELAEIAGKQYPSLCFIVVSGYEEFDYVKGAIKSGALDYILKPLSPAVLAEALNKVQKKLDQGMNTRRNHLIRNISVGIQPELTQILRCFPQQPYVAAIIRKNGLPRRFSSSNILEISSGSGELIYLYGRDDRESLYLLPQTLVTLKPMDQLIQGIARQEQEPGSYQTTVILLQSFYSEGFYTQIRRLYKTLDAAATVGYQQTILLADEPFSPSTAADIRQRKTWQEKIEIFIRDMRWEAFRNEFLRLMEQWEVKRLPQLALEKNIQSILLCMEQYQKGGGYSEELDYLMDEAFFYAASMSELAESLLFIFSKAMNIEESADLKMDTEVFVGKIRSYVKNHYAEPISLQSVCKSFGISQTYLNKLFRKYEGTTFYNYLIDVRIEKAKELLNTNQDFFIKDIAQLVGYENQFYFSKLFHAVVGVSPSEYGLEKRLDKT